MKLQWSDLEKKLRKELTEERYRHTLGVTYTASCLAMRYGENMEQARIAGLLHDCAKCIPNKKKLQICRKHEIALTEFEVMHPYLIHAKLGAYLAQTEYGIDTKAVLDAITWHTTGRPGMTLLEKIVYVADYIEPNRTKAPRLEEIRFLAFQNIDRCVYEILDDTISYLEERPDSIDETSISAFHYYQQMFEEQESAND